MLKKLRLNQTDKFSFSIVTRDIVTMLTSFIDGRPHDISIGSEQGEISNWDDIVIYKANGIYENIQVKQQTTDFSDAACSIDKSQRGKISPLDETMKSLAAWLSVNDPEKSTPPRRFKIILPEGAIKVKKEITVNQFERLCNKETTNHTTLEGFEQLIKNDVATKNICIWLQSWCDFPSNELILRAVKRLEIIVTGNQLSIDEQSEKLISEYFKDVNIVISLIHSFINEQSTYSSAISPRALLNDLKNYLLPGVKKWTQYYLDKDVWKISGIHDTINAIESPSQTVPSLWNPNSEGILKLNARTNSSNLAKAIIRLAFHINNLSTAHFHNLEGWLEFAKRLVGGTLGSEEDDCSSAKLIDSVSINESIDIRSLSNVQDRDNEADNLFSEMDQITWEHVTELVNNKIHEMNASPLRAEIERRWNKWKIDLNDSSLNRNKFLSSMLRPNAEGKDILVELRLGLKTIKLLRDGIYLLLVISVSLNETDSGWESFGPNLTVSTCALSHWSGPSGNPRRVRKLTDEGVDKLLGQEPSKIFILSNVETSTTDVIGESIAYAKGQNDTLASPHQPPILFTNSIKLRRLIAEGDISNLRSYIQEIIQFAMTPKSLG